MAYQGYSVDTSKLMKNFDLVSPHSKSLNDLLEHIHQSIVKEDACEIDNNYVAASYAGLETWSYLKQLMGGLCTQRQR